MLFSYFINSTEVHIIIFQISPSSCSMLDTLKMKVKVTQSCPTLCDRMDYTIHGILQARILEWVAFPFSGGSSQPRGRTQVSCLAGRFFFFFLEGRFFTSWAPREAQGCGVGSLSLLQRIFPTQKWNQGLLHCRRILYQLSFLCWGFSKCCLGNPCNPIIRAACFKYRC